jgi:hypothetical protein
VRKFMVLAALVAMVVSALAIPALADGRFNPANFNGEPQNGFFVSGDRGGDQGGGDQGDRGRNFQDFANGLEPQGFFAQDRAQERGDRANRFDNEDNNWWDNGNWWDNWWNNNHNNDPVVSQNFDQQAESGDVNQSFNVSNSGNNSNQCVGITGNANTGNAQNQIGVIQYGSEAGDFQFEDSGASLNVGGNSTTRCDQQVNQAAAAG